MDPMATEQGGDINPDDSATLIDGDVQPHDENAQGSTVSEEDAGKGGDTPSDEAGNENDQPAKDYPEPQSAKGAFVNDAGIDLNEEANHGPTVQGNKYGVNGDAARGFRDAAEAEAKTLIRRLEQLKTDYDNHDKTYQDQGGDAKFNDGENSSENHLLAQVNPDDFKRNRD